MHNCMLIRIVIAPIYAKMTFVITLQNIPVWLYENLRKIYAYKNVSSGYMPTINEPRQNQQKCMCAQRRLRSAWASAQSDQSLGCALSG